MKSLFVLLFSLLFITSCSFYKLTPKYWKMKKEFKNELEFVKKILDNPDSMQEIIETSEFYDKNDFSRCGNPYKYFIDYFKPYDKRKPKICGFCYSYAQLGKREENRFEDVKLISVTKSNRSEDILFYFHNVEDKTKLVMICRLFTK